MRRLRSIQRPPGRRTGFLLAGAVLASSLVAVPVALAASPAATSSSVKAVAVPDPTLSGPVVTQPDLDGTHGIPYTSSAVDLASHGYSEQEYFVAGDARAYTPDGPSTRTTRHPSRRSWR